MQAPHCDGSAKGAVPSLTVQFSELRPGVPLLRAAGMLTLSTAPELLPLLSRTLGKRPWALVLDLSGLSVLDVEVVPSLVDLANRAGEDDIGFYLVAADEIVRPPLDATGVEQLFDVHRDIDGALNALS